MTEDRKLSEETISMARKNTEKGFIACKNEQGLWYDVATGKTATSFSELLMSKCEEWKIPMCQDSDL